jgi:hypothetical protein
MVKGREKLIGLYEPWRKWCEFVLEVASARGFAPTVTSGFRSYSEQKRLYDAYRTGRSRIVAAPPGHSAHESGLAMDVVAGNGQQAALLALLKGFGGELVANDSVHVQYPGWSRRAGS